MDRVSLVKLNFNDSSKNVNLFETNPQYIGVADKKSNSNPYIKNMNTIGSGPFCVISTIAPVVISAIVTSWELAPCSCPSFAALAVVSSAALQSAASCISCSFPLKHEEKEPILGPN